MNWILTRDVGERGPAKNLNVFTWLHITQTKRFFNTVKETRLCLKGESPAKSSNVFEKFHIIELKRFFKTVKWAGPCLGEHDHPFIWTLLKVCTTPKQNDASTPRNELGRDRGCWGARPSHKLECFYVLHNIQTNNIFNIVRGIGPCLGEHGPAINSSVFEKFHTIQMKRVFNTVKWAGPCLGEHDHPFIWTLLKICTTSKQNDSWTPRNELGRDRRSWGARPSHQLESVKLAA